MDSSSAALYKYYDGSTVPLQSENCLFRSELDGVSRIVENDVLMVARLCGDFASLADHGQKVISAAGSYERPTSFWGDILAQAVANGMLVSRDDVEQIVSRSLFGHRPRRRFGTIGIPTRDRPRLLGRLLSSLSANLGAFSREVDVVIMDDSESVDTRKQNIRALAPFVRDGHMRIRYGSRQTRQRAVSVLSKRYDFPQRIVEFALLGVAEYQRSVGACRNSIAADCFGESILYLDDDVQCRTAAIPGMRDQVFIGVAPNLFATCLFPSPDDMKAVPLVEEDLLGLHEHAMNMWAEPPSAATAPLPDVSYATARLLAHIQGRNCQVMVTQMGLIGDCACDSLLPCFLAKPENLEQLAASPEHYTQALRSRAVLRGPRGWLIADQLECMAFCMGVDNSAVMPPFSPVLRGQELVLAALVHACIPGALFGLIPRAILHDPGQARLMPGAYLHELDEGGAALGNMREMEVLRFPANVMLSNTINSFQIPMGIAPTEALDSMGRYLQDLAHLQSEDFRRAMQPANIAAFTNTIHRLEAVAQAGGPDRWLEDVRAMGAACLFSLNSCDQSIPVDMERVSGPEEAQARFKSFLGDFGGLLQIWPDLMRCARELRTQGGLGLTSELQDILAL